MQFTVNPKRWPDNLDFSDLTASKQIGPATPPQGEPQPPGAVLDIPFDVDPSPAEAAKILNRLQSVNANDEVLVGQAKTAHANNLTYLAIVSPTNAQVVAQVQALTRQVNGLIRWGLNDLTGTN